jgi:hypothetical protein
MKSDKIRVSVFIPMTQYKKVLECCKKVAVLKTLPAEKCSLDRMLKMFYLKKTLINREVRREYFRDED